MMYASIYGRLGKDAQSIATKTGNPMTAASVAVSVGQRDEDATMWIRVICFGRLAELLAKHNKADMISASGRLELSKWTAADGAERESWQLIADALHSARTVRPSGGRRPGNGTRPAASPNEPPPFDDALPF